MNVYTVKSLIPSPEEAHSISKTSKGLEREGGLYVCSLVKWRGNMMAFWVLLFHFLESANNFASQTNK